MPILFSVLETLKSVSRPMNTSKIYFTIFFLHCTVIQILLGSESNVDEHFLQACKNNDIESVTRLLSQKPAVNYQDAQGDTALIYTTMHGYTQLAELLIEHDAKPDQPVDHYGNTALHWAISTNNANLVQKFINRDAKIINIANHNGCTALHWAIWTQNTDLIATLLEHGANVDAQDQDGQTPSDYAQLQADSHILDLLDNYVRTTNQ